MRIVVYSSNQTIAETACIAAFDRIAELDSIMSDYREDSELMKLCKGAGGKEISVSKDLLKVVTMSLEVSKRSNGAFDITAGPLVKLWRSARKTGKLPTQLKSPMLGK